MRWMLVTTAAMAGLAGCDASQTLPNLPPVPVEETADTGTSTGPTTDTTTPPEPEFGVMTVTVDGRDYELALTNPVGITSLPDASLELRAEHVNRVADLGLFLLDTSPIAVGSYDLGQWGGASEQSAIALTVYREGEATRYTTPFGTTTPGSLEIEALDTVAGLASLSWSGTFEAYDELENPLGEVTVSGSVVDAPLEAGGN